MVGQSFEVIATVDLAAVIHAWFAAVTFHSVGCGSVQTHHLINCSQDRQLFFRSSYKADCFVGHSEYIPMMLWA